MPDCSACGHTIDEGDAYCRACGAATSVTPPTEPPTSGQTPPAAPFWRRAPLVALIVAAFVVVAVVLGFALSSGPSADDFVGTWTGGDEIGSFMTVEKGEDGLQVRFLEDSGMPVDVVPARVENGTLSFDYVADPKSDTAGELHGEATLIGTDRLRLTLNLGEAAFAGVDMTYSLTLTRIPEGSPTPASSPDGQADDAKDAAVKEGIHSIQVGIQSWAVDHKDKYPPVDAVRADGAVGELMDRWPTNPYSGEPMKYGPDTGDFVYAVDNVREDYTLAVHLGEGVDFTVR